MCKCQRMSVSVKRVNGERQMGQQEGVDWETQYARWEKEGRRGRWERSLRQMVQLVVGMGVRLRVVFSCSFEVSGSSCVDGVSPSIAESRSSRNVGLNFWINFSRC